MTINIGTADSTLRYLAAGAIAGMAFLLLSTALQVATLFLAGALVLTAACRHCPLYRRLKLSTSPINRRVV